MSEPSWHVALNMRPLLFGFAVLLAALVLPSTSLAAPPQRTYCFGDTPQFRNGFAELNNALRYYNVNPGAPTTCEYPDPTHTDAEQNTTMGLFYWRKALNVSVFTDGYGHWALTPAGMVVWYGSAIDPPARATRMSFASEPAPAPPVVPALRCAVQDPFDRDTRYAVYAPPGGRGLAICDSYRAAGEYQLPLRSPADQGFLRVCHVSFADGSTSEVYGAPRYLTYAIGVCREALLGPPEPGVTVSVR